MQIDVDATVNTMNCIDGMGKGIALQFKNNWLGNFDFDQATCATGKVHRGIRTAFDVG